MLYKIGKLHVELKRKKQLFFIRIKFDIELLCPVTNFNTGTYHIHICIFYHSAIWSFLDLQIVIKFLVNFKLIKILILIFFNWSFEKVNDVLYSFLNLIIPIILALQMQKKMIININSSFPYFYFRWLKRRYDLQKEKFEISLKHL